MDSPLVSVICLCYNQEKFVRDAIASVLEQTYHNLELIIVDDASTDNSTAIIKEAIKGHPRAHLQQLPLNVGNCKAFNVGFQESSGAFVIDLAADDLLLPDRIEKGVRDLLQRDERFGVQFGDAELISEDGQLIGLHSDRFPHKSVPTGDVYLDVIERYFICSPSMLIRRSVLEKLSGYDESLAYEDFDFWIRSSREYSYSYSPSPMVRKRIVKGSMSDRQFQKGSLQQWSTLRVLEKTRLLNRNGSENNVLDGRLRYELQKAIGRLDLTLALAYYRML